MNQIRNTAYNDPFILNRADPYIYKHTDGSYYFTASVPAYDKIILRKSDSLVGLKEAQERVLWVKHEKNEMSCHIWAPEMHYIEGKWYIYFAAGEINDVWKIRPFILECTGEDPMKDEWIERGMMKAAKDDDFSFTAFSLDSTVLKHKGENYYIWAEKVGAGQGISNLYIAKMESPLQLATQQVLLTMPDYDWERIGFWVNEGPSIIRHNGKIFLTYSASATGAMYCVGMLEADEDSDLLDPRSWKKSRNPVLVTDAQKALYGPGHNSFTRSDDDTKDIMVFHARQYEEIVGDPLNDPNRHTYLLEVKYDEFGTPIFDYENILKL